MVSVAEVLSGRQSLAGRPCLLHTKVMCLLILALSSLTTDKTQCALQRVQGQMQEFWRLCR